MNLLPTGCSPCLRRTLPLVNAPPWSGSIWLWLLWVAGSVFGVSHPALAWDFRVTGTMLTFFRGVFISKELKCFLELWINWHACGIWKGEPVLEHSCLAGISRGERSLPDPLEALHFFPMPWRNCKDAV